MPTSGLMKIEMGYRFVFVFAFGQLSLPFSFCYIESSLACILSILDSSTSRHVA